MPTYDYKCDACGHRFEQFQSIKAAPLKRCPACGKNQLHRLIGPGAGLIFKGSGFYITDYRSEGYKEKAKAETGAGDPKSSDKTKPAASDAPAAPKSDAPAALKKDAKPAGKPASKPMPKDS